MLSQAESAEVLETVCILSSEVRKEHIRSALARGLAVCQRTPAHDRKVAIAGSGPSLNNYLDELRAFGGEIWAINGAFEYLRRNGIMPTAFVGLDPQREMLDFFEDLTSATYYMSSCTHPDVLDHLKGCDVRLWHSNSDTIDAFPKGTHLIPGGITCITRAPFLAYYLGFRDVSIYGADSSYEEMPYAYATDVRKCDQKDETIVIRCNGRVFRTELGLMHQAENLGRLEEVFPKDAKLSFRCGGLLPAFLASMRTDDAAA